MNDNIFFFFYNLSHQSNFFDRLVVFFADTLPYIVILAAIIFLLFHHEVLTFKKLNKNPPDQITPVIRTRWKEIVLVFFSGIFAWCIAQVLKILFHTSRPFTEFLQVNPLFLENDYAFPSGHATFYMALAFALFFSHKKIGYIFMFIALLIGVARIIAGVHFPIDILGGFILGALIAYLVRFLYDKSSKRTSSKSSFGLHIF
ncbi:MAG: phosphatase PAP2 family protein [Patescibacteria group bacterium]